MASCDLFSCNFTGGSDDLFNKIKAHIASHSARSSCDNSHHSRSFFLPCATIPNFARSNVANVEAAAMSDF